MASPTDSFRNKYPVAAGTRAEKGRGGGRKLQNSAGTDASHSRDQYEVVLTDEKHRDHRLRFEEGPRRDLRYDELREPRL
jgi:hypothetical protein